MTQTATKSTELTTTVDGALVRGTATEVAITAGAHEFTIDEPDALGGTDKGANPIEHLLAALASCTVISYQVWADKLDLTLDGVDVELKGDIDLAGFFGAEQGVRPGFQGIELGVPCPARRAKGTTAASRRPSPPTAPSWTTSRTASPSARRSRCRLRPEW